MAQLPPGMMAPPGLIAPPPGLEPATAVRPTFTIQGRSGVMAIDVDNKEACDEEVDIFTKQRNADINAMRTSASSANNNNTKRAGLLSQVFGRYSTSLKSSSSASETPTLERVHSFHIKPKTEHHMETLTRVHSFHIKPPSSSSLMPTTTTMMNNNNNEFDDWDDDNVTSVSSETKSKRHTTKTNTKLGHQVVKGKKKKPQHTTSEEHAMKHTSVSDNPLFSQVPRLGAVPPPLPSKPPVSRLPASALSVPQQKLVQVMFDYIPEVNNQGVLLLLRGEMVNVVQEQSNGWWEGIKVSNGQRGLFPANFVQQVVLPPF